MLATALLVGYAAAQQPGPVVRVIAGATVYTGTGEAPLPDAVIVLEGDRITCVGAQSTCPVPARARAIDASGRWIVPGLIDTHFHLFWLPDPNDVEPLASGRNAERLARQLAQGVTTVRDASGHGAERQTLALREAAGLPEIPWPRIYVSGRVDDRAIARHQVAGAGELTERLLDMGVDGIKIRTGLTLDDVVAAVQAARRRGRPVYGHASELDARGNPVYTMDDAIRAGVAGVMHLNFDAPVDPERLPPRPPEPQGEANWLDWWLWANSLWLYSDPARETARIRALVEQRVWVEPTLAIQEELGRPEAASDADYVLPLNAAQRELYFRALRETMRFVARFHEAGGIIIAGTDNGRIHDELRLLVASGLSPQAALHAATRDAARALGWQDRVGTIEAGKFADLLILDADPLQDIANAARVWRVVKGGLLYDPARLK